RPPSARTTSCALARRAPWQRFALRTSRRQVFEPSLRAKSSSQVFEPSPRASLRAGLCKKPRPLRTPCRSAAGAPSQRPGEIRALRDASSASKARSRIQRFILALNVVDESSEISSPKEDSPPSQIVVAQGQVPIALAGDLEDGVGNAGLQRGGAVVTHAAQ